MSSTSRSKKDTAAIEPGVGSSTTRANFTYSPAEKAEIRLGIRKKFNADEWKEYAKSIGRSVSAVLQQRKVLELEDLAADALKKEVAAKQERKAINAAIRKETNKNDGKDEEDGEEDGPTADELFNASWEKLHDKLLEDLTKGMDEMLIKYPAEDVKKGKGPRQLLIDSLDKSILKSASAWARKK